MLPRPLMNLHLLLSLCFPLCFHYCCRLLSHNLPTLKLSLLLST